MFLSLQLYSQTISKEGNVSHLLSRNFLFLFGVEVPEFIVSIILMICSRMCFLISILFWGLFSIFSCLHHKYCTLQLSYH